MKRRTESCIPMFLAATAVTLSAGFFSTGAIADTSAVGTDSAETDVPSAPAEEIAENTDAEDSEADDKVAQADTSGTAGGDADAGDPTSSDSSGDVEGKLDETVKKDKKDKKKDDEGGGGSAPAALAPGGIVSSGSGLPVGMTASFSNAVGTGTFAAGYANNPSIQSSVSLSPSYQIYKFFDWQPNALLAGRFSTWIEWASSYTGAPFAGAYERQARVSDASASLILPGLLTDKWLTNISFTPIGRVIAPLSVASRFQNRLAGFGGAGMASWNWNTNLIGTFGLQGVGSYTAWTFSDTARTLRCGEQDPGVFTPGAFAPQDAGTGVIDAPAPAASRSEEYTDQKGVCRIRGRQPAGSAAHSATASWSFGDWFDGGHTMAVNGGVWHLFLRPLEDRPDLRSEYATQQSYLNFSEFSFGTVSYTYSVPIEIVNVQLSAGVTSLQGMFDGQNRVRNPFFDMNWFQGGNNFTQGFATVTVGI